MIEVYGLTVRGRRLARNPKNPDTPPYRVVHFLDKVRSATKETIGSYCSMNPVQTAVVLRALKARNIVAEEAGDNV